MLNSTECDIYSDVGILTYLSMMNTTADSYKARNVIIVKKYFYEQWKYMLNWVWECLLTGYKPNYAIGRK